MPVLVNRLKESGLVVCSYGDDNRDDTKLLIQEHNGIDAFLFKGYFQTSSLQEFKLVE